MLSVPAMLDCVEAQIRIEFTDGDRHTETIYLDSDTADMVYEIDYLLMCYMKEDPVVREHTQEDWIARSRGTADDDYVLEASETLEAIFDTYIAQSSATVLSYKTSMVDHHGNIMPLDIEYNI